MRHIKGFGHELVHARGQRLVVFLCARGGRQRQHRCALVTLLAFVSPNFLGGFKAIHYRHLAIHQDQIKSLLLELVHSFQAILGDHGSQPHALQDFLYQNLIDLVVLYNQYVGVELQAGKGFLSIRGRVGQGLGEVAGSNRPVQPHPILGLQSGVQALDR